MRAGEQNARNGRTPKTGGDVETQPRWPGAGRHVNQIRLTNLAYRLSADTRHAMKRFMDLTPEHLRLYRETAYTVWSVRRTLTFRVGERCAGLDCLLDEHCAASAALITAFNPLGEQRDPRVNKLAQLRLRCALRRLDRRYLSAEGRSPPSARDRWWEPSLFALGTPIDEALDLARKFQQHAFVWVERGKAPELIPTPVFG